MAYSFTNYTLHQNRMIFTERNQLYSYLIDILLHFNRNIGQTLVRVIIKRVSCVDSTDKYYNLFYNQQCSRWCDFP